jgi:hypothetical protein
MYVLHDISCLRGGIVVLMEIIWSFNIISIKVLRRFHGGYFLDTFWILFGYFLDTLDGCVHYYQIHTVDLLYTHHNCKIFNTKFLHISLKSNQYVDGYYQILKEISGKI